MNKAAKIYVAGHGGLAGSAIVRKLEAEGFTNLLLKTHGEVDLTDQGATRELFAALKPEYVFLAAARVGGIMANSTYPAEFIHDNLTIATNVIHAAYHSGVKKLLNMGSSCIYPRMAPQPMKEEYLLTGPLEPTNAAYAIAKIAAIKMCRYYNEQYGTNFISVMPTNLYGPNDNFDLETSHALPALIRKIHGATADAETSVTLWGNGTPEREFLHVDDLADAVVFLMRSVDSADVGEFVNVGTGRGICIRDLAELIADEVGFAGRIEWDTSKPGGTPRKVLDVSRMTALGWRASIELRAGIRSTYAWFCEHVAYPPRSS